MSKLKYLLYSCSITLLLLSCGPTPQIRNIAYQNIVILSDLSSRTTNKPLKDFEEINKIIEYFQNDCVKPGEKIGDRSSIYFSTFSDRGKYVIDLGEIKDLGKKQRFINSAGEYSDNGLKQAVFDFEANINDAYRTISNPGLDLISMLQEKIDSGNLTKENTHFTDGIDTTFINYDNHIYIFTDGYLEYNDRIKNSQFHFGLSEIERIRKYCIDHSLDIENALDADKNLCLSTTKGSRNGYINIHVFETHERDKDDILQTYKHPKGLRDNEILEAVWRKWAKESGFKSFEWKKY